MTLRSNPTSSRSFRPWTRYAAAVLMVMALVITFSRWRLGTEAYAASGFVAVPSPFGGNGHNISFDGRIMIVRQGANDATGGWNAYVLRPGEVGYAPGGQVRLEQAFSPPYQVQPYANGENALGMCEVDAEHTPYRCTLEGERSADAAYACYDLVIFDSNAEAGAYNGLRQRDLRLWVETPNEATARVVKHEWRSGYRPVVAGTRTFRGIEPTMTRDGRLLVWQGHPDNDGKIDSLMYATNESACAAGGWDGPYSISHMFNDPNVYERYPLGDRQLRDAAGRLFADGDIVHGGYPWLFADGEAISFTATVMPCRAEEDPGGCGARRNAFSVIGYPTNWAVSNIDGPVNPSREDGVRLFFSSPGPEAFETFPLTGGRDVWPFFGSNTGNYVEVSFDDALDGRYAAYWHFNELVTTAGEFDLSRTPDVSGHFNTATMRGGAYLPAVNQGPFGKAVEIPGGAARLEVPDAPSLNPVAAMTVEMWLMLDAPADCDAGNNYRVLVMKGGLEDAYNLVIEDDLRVRGRVRAGDRLREVISEHALVVGDWAHVAMGYYSGPNAEGEEVGALALYINGQLEDVVVEEPGRINPSSSALLIGGASTEAEACPSAGHGSIEGRIGELRISRTLRELEQIVVPGNHARFLAQVVPPSVHAGETFQVELSFRNLGSTAWSESTHYRLGLSGFGVEPIWGPGRILTPGRVEPGQEVTYRTTLRAPDEPGEHWVGFRLVHEGAEWFGERSPVTRIDVLPVETDAGTPVQVHDAGIPIHRLDAGVFGRLDGGSDAGSSDSGTAVVQPGDGGVQIHPLDGGARIAGDASIWIRRPDAGELEPGTTVDGGAEPVAPVVVPPEPEPTEPMLAEPSSPRIGGPVRNGSTGGCSAASQPAGVGGLLVAGLFALLGRSRKRR